MSVARWRPSKYRAVATVVDNIRFASKKEAQRYGELKLLAKAGEIRHLELQPVFPLEVRSVRLGKYLADFAYEHKSGVLWVRRIEDTKGFDLPFGRWKRRHAEAQYGITVEIIT